MATPAWVLADELRDFFLHADDFEYIARSRDWPTTQAHLFEPHNTHVVPIFRVWTFVLVNLTGQLKDLQKVFAAAGYLALAASMTVMGWLVARETRQAATGLSAMAILGISTVTHPAVTWFSAGQALWAGVAILLTIARRRAGLKNGGPFGSPRSL